MTQTSNLALKLLSLLIGSSLWFFVIHSGKSPEISLRRLLASVLGVGLFCRICFVVFTPDFYAPDELSHFKYIEYLYENKALPVTSDTDVNINEYEYYQPPLYYLSAVPVFWLSEALSRGDFHAAVIAVRIFSVLLWLLNVFLAYKVLNNLGVDDILVRSTAFAVVCLLPSYTFTSSVINNDNLAITLGGAILYFLTRKNPGPANFMVLGLLLGLALLTKLTSVVYFFLVFIFLLAERLKNEKPPGKLALNLIFSLITGLIIWLPWALRMLTVYGSITFEKAAVAPKQWSSLAGALIANQNQIQKTFWACSGITNNVKLFSELGMIFSYAALIGLATAVIKKRGFFKSMPGENKNFFLASALSLIVNLGLVLRFGMLYGQAQGRYLFVLIIPIAIFLGTGLRFTKLADFKRSYCHVAGFWMAYVFSFTIYSLYIFRLLA